jgi:mannose-6-phosphate isomerase
MSTTHARPSSVATASDGAQGTPIVFDVRPWGSWHVLDVGAGYKVKRITVSPHSRLSLQTHVHRSEHWVVVTGVATCTVGERTVLLRPGGRVDVPNGAPHRIANEQEDELILLELQLGAT